MNEPKRRFFSGDSLQQALVQAANHFHLDPEEIAYRSIEKKHGFIKTRRKVMIEVNPDAPKREKAPPAPAPVRVPALAPPAESRGPEAPRDAAAERPEAPPQAEEPRGYGRREEREAHGRHDRGMGRQRGPAAR